MTLSSALLRRTTAIVFASLLCFPLYAQQASSASRHKVVVISLDAFGAASLHEPQLPAPTLHALMKMGSYAVSMQPINPTVTWPNHTTMVTGVNASQHHVLVNGLIVNQRTAMPPKQDADTPKSQLVAVPTVYDAAHQAGLTTAEVDWVAIGDAKSIDWRFSERPHPDGPIEQDLVQQGVLTHEELTHFNKPSQAWRDTIAFLDDRVKDVVDAVRAAGDFDRTTFLIVSDHGQQSVHQILHPNVLLKQAGLQGASVTGPVFCMPDGGFALVFQQHATEASRAKLKSLFAGKPGIRAALTPDEAAKEGWPTPAQTDQAPDLLLYAADGYSFSGGDTGNFVTDTKEVGSHGYPNTVPLMQTIFIAAGSGIQAKGEIPAFPNLDVAPTIAHLLGISLGKVEGKPLTEILK